MLWGVKEILIVIVKELRVKESQMEISSQLHLRKMNQLKRRRI